MSTRINRVIYLRYFPIVLLCYVCGIADLSGDNKLRTNGIKSDASKISNLHKGYISPGSGEISRKELLFQLTTAREELRTVRYELSEILKKYEKLQSKYEAVNITVAEMLNKAKITASSEKEKELLQSLKLVCNYAGKLADTTEKFCIFIEKNITNNKNIDKLLKLKINLRIRELREECDNLKLITGAKRLHSPPGVCRVLEINKQTGYVLISAGFIKGVRCGLVWYADNNQKTKLRVITVGRWLSIAIVTEGNISDLTIGDILKSGRR